MEAYPTLHKVPNNSQGLHYSDHLAVFALLEIDEKLLQKSIQSSDNNDIIIDEKTKDILCSACHIVEETIQRIQRQRLFCAFAIFILIYMLIF